MTKRRLNSAAVFTGPYWANKIRFVSFGGLVTLSELAARVLRGLVTVHVERHIFVGFHFQFLG